MKLTRRNLCIFAGGLSLGAIFVAFLPLFPGAAIYQGVGPALGLRQITHGKSKEFLLEDGNLYLLRQQTWHGLLLITWVRFVYWTEPELKELRERFPELQKSSLWEELPRQ